MPLAFAALLLQTTGEDAWSQRMVGFRSAHPCPGNRPRLPTPSPFDGHSPCLHLVTPYS